MYHSAVPNSIIKVSDSAISLTRSSEVKEIGKVFENRKFFF